jgi:hypothetical protein
MSQLSNISGDRPYPCGTWTCTPSILPMMTTTWKPASGNLNRPNLPWRLHDQLNMQGTPKTCHVTWILLPLMHINTEDHSPEVKLHIHAQVECLASVVASYIHILLYGACINLHDKIHLAIFLYNFVITLWIKSERTSSTSSLIKTCWLEPPPNK